MKTIILLIWSVFTVGVLSAQVTDTVSVDSTDKRENAKEKVVSEFENNPNHHDSIHGGKGGKNPEGPTSQALRESTFLWLTASGWTAIGTIIIGLFTIALFYTSWKQNKAIEEANKVAEKAANAAERSSIAMVESERGRLMLAWAHYNAKTNEIHIGFRNIGKGPVIVTADEHTPSTPETNAHTPPFFRPTPFDGRKVAIVTGQEIATNAHPGRLALISPIRPAIPNDQFGRVGADIILHLQGQVVYYTHLNARRRLVYTIGFGPADPGTSIHTHYLFVGADTDGINDAYNREEGLPLKRHMFDRPMGDYKGNNGA